MIMTHADQAAFAAATQCHICQLPFNDAVPGDKRVRDHDHITGKFRGAAHSKCNLQYRKQYKLPIFFHNFRAYDSHLITMGLAKFQDDNP